MSILASDRVYTVEDAPDLISRCLLGDQAAYAALYRIYAGDVYRLVYSLLGHREDAEEVVQDTFVYAIKNLRRYDREKASFRTWLFVIATSRARNKRRRRWLPTVSLRRLLQTDGEPAVPDSGDRPPEGKMEDASQQRTLHDALAQLSPKLREAAVLRYFDGLTYREMGHILGISHKTAESRVRLAHEALRVLLDGADGSGSRGEMESN
jgi:RNA polymerase sigma-70 factor, ECF subfamily